MDDIGLDFGPAPGDPGMPRTGNIKDWAAAHTPAGQQKQVAPPNPYNPDNKPPQIDIQDAYNPPRLLETPPTSISPSPETPPQDPIDQLLSGPSMKGGTVKQMVKFLVEGRGMTMGEAFGYVEQLDNEGDLIVQNLDGIENFRAKMPSKGRRFLEAAGREMAKFPVNATEMAGNALGNLGVPGAGEIGAAAGQVFNEMEQAGQNAPETWTSGSLKAQAANAILPSLVGEAPAWILGTAAISSAAKGALFALPRFAAAGKILTGIAAAARMGKAYTIPTEAAASLASATKWVPRISNVAGQLGTGIGMAVVNKEDPKIAAASIAAFMGVGFGAQKLLRWFHPHKLPAVTRWIAQESGLPGTVIAQRMTSYEALLNYLTLNNTPPAVLKTFFDAAPGHAWNNPIGKATGEIFARNGATAVEIENILTLIPKEGHRAVTAGYRRTLESLGRGAEWEAAQAKNVAGDVLGPLNADPRAGIKATENILGLQDINPRPFPPANLNRATPVLDNPTFDPSGAVEYRGPGSKLSRPEAYVSDIEKALQDPRIKNGTVLRMADGSEVQVNHIQPGLRPDGTVMTMEGEFVQGQDIRDIITKKGVSLLTKRVPQVQNKSFLNPFSLNYNPAVETAAEAVLRTLAKPSIFGKVALNTLQRTAFSSTEAYNQAAKELAYGVAKKNGHDAIFALGKNPDDHIFVDLLGFTGDVGEITKKIEGKIEAISKKMLESFPLLFLGSAGAVAAYEALSPNEAGAMELPIASKMGSRLFGRFTRGMERIVQGFTEMVSPEGRSIRPPEHADLRSPFYDPLQGVAYSHDDIALKLLSATDKEDLVANGYLRTFRLNDEIGIQFDPASGSEERASSWLQKNYKFGDIIHIDRGSEGRTFSLPGDAGRFLRGKLEKLALMAATTGVVSSYNPDEVDAMEFPVKGFGQVMAKWFRQGATVGAKNTESMIADLAQAGSKEESVAIIAHWVNKTAGETPKSYFSTTDKLSAEAAVAPDKAFGWMSKFLNFDPGEHLATAPYAITMPSHAVDHDVYRALFGQFVVRKGDVLTGSNSMVANLKNATDQILEKLPKGPQFDNVEKAIKGLVQDSKSGAWTQTLPGVSPEINAIATHVRQEIDDVAFRLRSGVDHQARTIIKSRGLEENEDTWRKLKFIQSQDPATDALPIWKGKVITNNEAAAAQETKGMINPTKWSDLNTQEIVNGLSRYPIEGEQAILKNQIRVNEQLYPQGAPPNIVAQTKEIEARLVHLIEQDTKARLRKSINLDQLGSKARFAPVEKIPDVAIDKDLKQVLHRYIDQVFSETLFAEQLHFFKGAARIFDAIDPKAASYIRTFFNVERGLRSMESDSYWASRLNRFGFNQDTRSVRKNVSIALQLQYISKLAINPAYGLINTTQPLMTTLGVTRTANFLRGLGVTLANPRKAVAEATAANILKTDSHILEEVGQPIFQRATKVTDFIPKLSENWNRVLTYQVGKIEALDRIAKGKLTDWNSVSKLLKPLIDPKAFDKGPAEIAHAYATALTRGTQFMSGTEGRPLTWSGGPLRRTTGQFKSFQASYLNLLRQTLKSGSKEERRQGYKLLGLLAFFGGVNAVAVAGIGSSVISLLRQGSLAAGIDPKWVPDHTILGKVFELVGFDPLIDISGATAPLNFPNPFTNLRRAAGTVAGPTVENAFNIVEQGFNYFGGKQSGMDTAQNIGRSIAPAPMAGLEAAQEAGLTPQFLDELGFRGGMYSRTGKPLVKDRDNTNIMLRALNLVPSAARSRAEYIHQIERAWKEGQPKESRGILDEARSKGYIIDTAALRNIKSRLTKESNLGKPNQVLKR